MSERENKVNKNKRITWEKNLILKAANLNIKLKLAACKES
jgi:hypothetical protein